MSRKSESGLGIVPLKVRAPQTGIGSAIGTVRALNAILLESRLRPSDRKAALRAHSPIYVLVLPYPRFLS